jgi:TatD DNase family protein
MSQNNILIVDSHCHLNYEGLSHRVDEVIENAHKAGVGIMQSICTRLSEFEDIYKIAENNPGVYASVGVHPHDADAHICSHEHGNDNKPLIEANMTAEQLTAKLLELAKRPKTIGIGETGLDYHYENSSRKAQQESFLIHMEAANKSGLPIIIHTRDAEEDTYRMMKDFMDGNNKNKDRIASLQTPRNDEIYQLKGLLHCFTGTADMAKKALDLGFYISISGIITFKNANELRDVVKNVVPMDRLLVETDSPFLAPLPFRGKVCEPAYTRNTAEFIAELKGISLEELAAKTTENFLRLFDKVKL